jgi:hypothetical protein
MHDAMFSRATSLDIQMATEIQDGTEQPYAERRDLTKAATAKHLQTNIGENPEDNRGKTHVFYSHPPCRRHRDGIIHTGVP